MMMEGYFVDSNGIKYYPRPSFHIGYILESEVEIDPGEIYGGTWELHGVGRVTVCVDKTNTKMNEAGKTFGSSYIQKHHHDLTGGSGNLYYQEGNSSRWLPYLDDNPYKWSTTEVGEGTEGNYQPSIAVYRYVRIA